MFETVYFALFSYGIRVNLYGAKSLKQGDGMMKKEQFTMQITGVGIIFYSPQSVSHIAEGENYLEEHYMKPEDVIQHTYAGSIVGVCTGTPGDFNLNIYQDVDPDIDAIDPDYALKLCLKVTDNIVHFRDLYALLDWEKEDESEVKVHMENGNYEVIVCSWIPESGILGDNQRIDLYLNQVDTLPELRYKGVPSLL